jgi:hypothetical protein
MCLHDMTRRIAARHSDRRSRAARARIGRAHESLGGGHRTLLTVHVTAAAVGMIARRGVLLATTASRRRRRRRRRRGKLTATGRAQCTILIARC